MKSSSKEARVSNDGKSSTTINTPEQQPQRSKELTLVSEFKAFIQDQAIEPNAEVSVDTLMGWLDTKQQQIISDSEKSRSESSDKRHTQRDSPLRDYLIRDFPYGICHLDDELRVIDANHHFYKMFTREDDTTDINFQQLFARSRLVHQTLIQLKSDDYLTVKDRQFLGIRANKSTFPCRLKIHILKKESRQSESSGYVIMVRDITEDVNNKEKLSLANQMIHDVIEAMPARIYWKDSESNYLGCNQMFARDVGYESVDDFQQQHLSSINGFDDSQHFQQIQTSIIDEQISFHTQQRQLVLANGETIWIQEFIYPLKDAKNITYGIIGSYEDISHMKRTEAENTRLADNLQQAQKMESLGRLVGGVAHDFNNFLAVILGYTQLIGLQIRLPEKQTAHLKKIENASVNAKSLVEKLLMFSRKQPIHPKRLELTTHVNSTIDTFSSLLGEDIDVSIEIATSPLFVQADESQIEQVLLNLLVNARDAMQVKDYPKWEEKRLVVRVHMVKNPHTQMTMDSRPYACFSVSDNGSGMDQHTLEHLFDPFFSTKQEMGTGLGLSTVFGIVSQNHGDISVESSPANGATFNVFWPLDENQTTNSALNKGDSLMQYLLPINQRGGLVCVVEDEADVRELTSSLLVSQGYQVIACDNGKTLMELLASSDISPSLLITDVILMDGETGKNVADLFTMKYGDLPVLYMSGYNNEVIAKRGLILKGTEYLKKPFNLRDLLSKVDDILGCSHESDEMNI